MLPSVLELWIVRRSRAGARRTLFVVPAELVPSARASVRLVEEYLRRFGPATEADVAMVDRVGEGTGAQGRGGGGHGRGERRAGPRRRRRPDGAPEPTGALLPALDPTPMGWKQRDWFPPEDSGELYDAYGNVGPTVWWEARWSAAGRCGRTAPSRPGCSATGCRRTARRRGGRGGAGDVARRRRRGPSFRTPLERRLSGG